MSQILIIEDDKIKIEKLTSFLTKYSITLKESFRSGVFELKNNFKKYEMLILDMTIPLWEKGNNDLGGNFEQFGGESVLREMKRRKLFVPTILFTMFDIFPYKNGSLSFAEVNAKFKLEFSPFYKGAVFYNADDESWKNELIQLINESSSVG
jgi:hypothetical protein